MFAAGEKPSDGRHARAITVESVVGEKLANVADAVPIAASKRRDPFIAGISIAREISPGRIWVAGRHTWLLRSRRWQS